LSETLPVFRSKAKVKGTWLSVGETPPKLSM
jgi:hypothetical protein